jgi:8-oxo-dGTP pyrophosphatase MutT (NUDIX family)
MEVNGKYLIAYDNQRKQWAFPAGKRESNESFLPCVKVFSR